MLEREKYSEQYSLILEAATELFSNCGYESVSTTQIARAAGVSQPSIHYHFGSKTELWVASLRNLADRIKHEIHTDWTIIDEMEPIDALRYLCEVILDVSIYRPELGRFIMLEGQAGGERLEWLYEMVMKVSYETFCRLIEKGIARGQIKDHKPHHILMLLHGAAVTYFNMAPLIQHAFHEKPSDLQPASEFKQAFLDIVIEGIRAPKGAAKSAARAPARKKQSGAEKPTRR